MQKFFSLVCAILLVVSASAAPVAQKAQLVKKAPVAVEQMQKVQLEKAQVANFNQLSAAPALTVSNQKAQTVRGNQMLKKAQAPARRSAANARKVVNAPLNTNITIGTFSPATYEGEYYVVLTDANSTTQFYFDINTSENPFELGKTYTLDEMLADYVAMGDADDWYAWDPATAATYTETKDEKGLTHIVASMTTESGETYDLTYDQPEPQSKTIVASDFSMVDYGTDMYMTAFDAADNKFLFDVLYTGSFEFGKTYTLADMDSDYSWYKLASGGGNAYTEASITVTKDQDGLLHVVAAVVLDNGDSYDITYDEKAFEPSGVQIEVNGTDLNGRYLSSYGFYLYTATWGDYTVQLAFDAEEEKASYTNDDFIADYGLIYSNSEKIQLLKLASDNITITNTETTKTLAGSIYAKNGDEYILNLVYEKPDAKYIDINVANATLTNKSVAGFWTISGQTADKNNSFSIYFISKALQGTFTDVAKFDSYSTWVSDKSSGSNVYYENLSEVNLTSVVDGDSLKITGTLNLADANGNPAIVTVYITTPFTQTWGEWADFAPFDLNTGKYTYATLGAYTQTGIEVLERKDNTGLKQYTLKNWGKGYYDGVGQDLILNMNPDYTFTFVSEVVNVGAEVYLADVATAYNNPAYASFNSYDPETGVFSFYTAVVFASNGSVYTAAKESLVMDRPILERDTVEVTADMKLLAEPAKGIIKVSAELNDTTYILEVVGADTVGTFSLADGTLSQQYYYGIVSAAGRSDFAEGEVTIAKNETGLKLNGLMIGVDEKAYVLDWTYTPITERDTVYVNSNTLDAFYQGSPINGYVYQSSNTDYELIQFVTKSSEKLGTFAVADLNLNYSAISADGETNYIFFQDGEFTVSEDEEGFKLIGTLIGEDEKAYVFNLIQPAGVLEKDTDAPFDATFAWKDMVASIDDGVISISVQKGTDLALELVLFTDPAATEIPEGVYTISDSQEAGTALKSIGYAQGANPCFAATLVQEDKLYLDDMWFIVEGTVTLSYDEYGKLKVVVDGKNSYDQPVTALVQYEKLEPKSTVVITDGELAIDEEMYAKYGITTYIVENDNYGFILPVYADTIVGDFTEDLEYALAKVVNLASMAPANIIDVESIVVTGIDKNLTLTAKVLGADTIMYEITATGFYGALEYDTNADYEGNFNIVDLTIGQSSKYITIKGINEVGDSINFAFVGSLVDNAIPAGEYTEVMASTGLNTKNNPTTSFVWNAENRLWFVQGGKLTVAEDGSMIFEGLNSYEKNVTINFIAPVPPVTDYYLVGWINGAAYGIEGDIDNFGDYHFVDGKVRATFDELSYVQVKDNNKQIYGTDTYKAPVNVGNAILFKTGTEKIAINGGAEYEYTLTVNEDGTLEIFYEEVTTGLNDINADVKANKVVRNGRLMVIKNAKVYSVLGQPIQ